MRPLLEHMVNTFDSNRIYSPEIQTVAHMLRLIVKKKKMSTLLLRLVLLIVRLRMVGVFLTFSRVCNYTNEKLIIRHL